MFDPGVDTTHPAFNILEVEVGRGSIGMFWMGYLADGMTQPARPICYRCSLWYPPDQYPKNLLDSTIFLSRQL